MTGAANCDEASTGGERGTVIVLNYHELSTDARVLKQARALGENGFAVTVYCDRPQGLPDAATIDGIKVVRFQCFSGDLIEPSDVERFGFLSVARSEIINRFLPYAQACRDYRLLTEKLSQRFGADFAARLKSGRAKELSGVQKVRSRIGRMVLKSALAIPVRVSADGSATVTKRLRYRQTEKALRATRKSLYQASSLVFASNLLRQPFPDRVCAIHAHDIYCLPGGVLLSQKFGVPLIYDAHEYEPARATKMAETGPNLPELLEDDCLPYVSRIITVSENIGALYGRRFSGPPPTIVMNSPECGFAPSETEQDQAVCIRTNAGLDDNVPVVVFTGGVQRAHRGLDVVLAALKDVPSAVLVCLGPRHPTNDEWLLNQASYLGVRNRVVLLPAVDARLVPVAIRKATVAVCPIQDVSLSYRFSMPNKLFEAVFAGIPICVSDLPDMRRFVEDLGVGKVMDQTDPKNIAETLRYVIENRSEFSLTPGARAKLLNTYSWEAQVRKLLDLYADVLGGAGVPGKPQMLTAET